MSPTEVLVEFVRRLNGGDYTGALGLWAYDPLTEDGITLDEFQTHLDARITHGRTVQGITGVSEEPHGADTKVTVRIAYRDGATQDGNLVLRRVGTDWRITSKGSLI